MMEYKAAPPRPVFGVVRSDTGLRHATAVDRSSGQQGSSTSLAFDD